MTANTKVVYLKKQQQFIVVLKAPPNAFTEK